jgi:outer membrane protein
MAQAEDLALTASPDVAAARARLDQSRYALDAARTGSAPAFVASYAQTPQGNPPGPNVVSRLASAELQWTLADVLGAPAAVRAAALTFAAAQADERAAENAERIKTIGLYYDALEALAVAAARGDALALALAQRDAAAARERAGDAPHLDTVRGDIAVARAQADLAAAQAADANAAEALQTETARPAGDFAATVAGPSPAVNPALVDPQAAVALARTLRPEIASARLSAQAAQASVAAARADGAPALTVGGGYVTGTDSGVPVDAPAVSASLTVPLGSGARDRVAIAAAKAREAQAQSAAVERQILLDAAASARDLAASERAAAAMSRARASAEEELQATQVGYDAGATASLEVASARQTYDQAVVDELAARYALEKARATLDVEVGR